MKINKLNLIVSGIVIVISSFIFITPSHQVDFNTEIKPIFNKKCITCHGGVRRQGNFSLLFRSEALMKTKSGKFAIVPGDPDRSEMIRRIQLKDPEERMPYHHDALSSKEISVLKNWIKQGAKWGNHWAYVPVQKPEVPISSGGIFGWFKRKTNWAKNDIDQFIFQKLEEHDLKPSLIADKYTLLRRVSLDLTGMPAPNSLVDKYLNKDNRFSYKELVDSLLASSHFGEKWANLWLDLARYADTKGYERDDSRNIWHYRDWLIKAFNKDMPYNQFLIEQLAGDLIPDATDDQFIATAYNRNTMTNDEGGTDNEEFRTAAVLDRVNTVWQGLMGTTFACTQCHSHPYDPFTHEEFYKFMAFFNDTRDEDTYADYPVLRHYNSEDSIKVLFIKNWFEKHGFKDKSKEVYRFLKTWQPSINSIQANHFVNCELNDTKWLAMRNHGIARLNNIQLTDKNELIFRYSAFVSGSVLTIHVDNDHGQLIKTISLPKTKGWQVAKLNFDPVQGVHDIYFSYENSKLKRPEDNGLMFDWFYFTSSLPGKEFKDYDSIQKAYWSLIVKDIPATPVMIENPEWMHRATFVFERGNWLVKGKMVTPGVPHSLNEFPKNTPKNRLGLAYWLTNKANPLTARTLVNRMWEQLFGTGLVETLEDMGTQGAEPTHKELLDYLSWQFMNDYNWSIKKLLKQMVLSATYQQDSKIEMNALQKDPGNKWYGRGPRVRLSAEEIRDQALSIAGRLSEKMYGPSVMPWQPEGIWMSPWNGSTWQKSKYEDQYRRAIYTYLKRTAPYPSMLSFDGVGREICTARRIRTNTPLQALVTLNDSVYIEASRLFAYKMLRASVQSNDIRSTIANGFEMALYKPISQSRLNIFYTLYLKALKHFNNNPEMTCEMIGEDNENNNPKTAALVVVANAMLNMDELITKN